VCPHYPKQCTASIYCNIICSSVSRFVQVVDVALTTPRPGWRQVHVHVLCTQCLLPINLHWGQAVASKLYTVRTLYSALQTAVDVYTELCTLPYTVMQWFMCFSLPCVLYTHAVNARKVFLEPDVTDMLVPKLSNILYGLKVIKCGNYFQVRFLRTLIFGCSLFIFLSPPGEGFCPFKYCYFAEFT
jgi:hypothetical protein